MMGGGPPLPARMHQSVQDDESIAYDAYDPLTGLSDDDWEHLEDERRTSSRRARSASPLGIFVPLSFRHAKSLLDAEKEENDDGNLAEYTGSEDAEREEQGGSAAEEAEISEASRADSPEPPQPDLKVEPSKIAIRENSGHWRYDHKYGDYVQKRPDGRPIGYREYQQRGKATTAKAAEPSVIDKPKRFYTFGRIFKLNWADPSPDGKPVPRPRWFVVVRRRLHHSLCFAITTGGGASFNGSGKARGGKSGGNGGASHRGRQRDFVVLFPAGFLPPAADDDEGIERDPVGVIIEDAEQCISPQARLDCARIYTVEFDVAVVKIGRVDMKDFPKLEEYYQECVK